MVEMLDRICRLCGSEFLTIQTKLTPCSTCPKCHEETVKLNIRSIVDGWIKAFPEVNKKIKFRTRKLKNQLGWRPKIYFYIDGGIKWDGKWHGYVNAHSYVYNYLLPLIKKSFSNAHLSSGNLGNDGFSIVIAEY